MNNLPKLPKILLSKKIIIFTSMGDITVWIDDEIEHKFREAVAIKKKSRNRPLGEAVEEALVKWIEENTK